jgi:hypothetical protein
MIVVSNSIHKPSISLKILLGHFQLLCQILRIADHMAVAAVDIIGLQKSRSPTEENLLGLKVLPTKSGRG